MGNKSQEEKEIDALKSLDESNGIGKVNKESILNKKTIDSRLSLLNLIEIDKSNMLYKGMFYPETWVFKARAASGDEVVALSTINSEDPLSVDEGINSVLYSCLRIEDTRAKKIISVDNVFEFDRLWFLLFIRDMTMQNKEYNISYKVGCQHCDEKELEIVLSFDNLVEKQLTEYGKKYLNVATGGFIAQTASYGMIKMQPMTLKRAQIYKDYLNDCMAKRINPDAKFTSLLPMIITSDNENDPDIIQSLYAKYRKITGDLKLYSIYKKLHQEFSIGIEETIKCTCNKCRKEGSYEIQFPDGLNNIFIIPNIDSELL